MAPSNILRRVQRISIVRCPWSVVRRTKVQTIPKMPSELLTTDHGPRTTDPTFMRSIL
jgi:hypothetical protein